MFRVAFVLALLVSLAAAQEPPAGEAEKDKPTAKPADAPPETSHPAGHQGAHSPAADEKAPQPPVPDREKSPPPVADDERPRLPSQPTPEEIIKAFQQDRPVAAPIRSVGSEAATKSAERVASLVREGEFVNDLSGRLAHDGNWWTLVFESDSADAPRPPIRLLPNQLLERMMRETEAASSSVTYIVSGEVTLFESENYLLLRKVLRTRNVSALSK